MLIETPKLLPKDLEMLCYACEKVPATHLCRYKIGELVIQVCLCELCMKIDTRRLLENTIGIRDNPNTPTRDSLTHDDANGDNAVTKTSWSVQL